MPHADTKDQLVEQPAIGLFGELGWRHHRTRDLPLPRLRSGQVALASVSANGELLCQRPRDQHASTKRAESPA
jgi:hypothetical protein